MFSPAYLLLEVGNKPENFNNEKEEIKDLIRQGEKEKANGIFSKLIQKIYKKDGMNMVDDVPSIFELIRWGIIISSVTITPVLPVVTYIADKLIEEKVNESTIGRTIGRYKREISLIDKKIESETDSENIKDLKAYKRKLEDGIYKMEEYKEKISSYKEQQKTNESTIVELIEESSFITFVTLIEAIEKKDYNVINDYMSMEKEFLLEKVSVGAKVKHADKAVSDRVDNAFDKAYKTVKSSLLSDSREDIIRNNLPKASKIIKGIIAAGAVTAVTGNMAITLIGVLGTLGIRKKLKGRERQRILNELKLELEIVNEKIRDADSNGDRDKKYELMRIRNTLNRNIEKIRYNLKYVPGDSQDNND